MFPHVLFTVAVFPNALFPGSGSGAAGRTPDLLSALVAFLRSGAATTAPFGQGFGAGGFGQGPVGGAVRIYTQEADAGAYPPYLIVAGYEEPLPGPSLEDQVIPVDLVVVTTSLDAARNAAAAIRAAIDTPNISAAATGRGPFIFNGGAETILMRDDSKPQRLPGTAKGGGYLYLETIHYEFYVSPEVTQA